MALNTSPARGAALSGSDNYISMRNGTRFGAGDIAAFKEQFLNPFLEHLAWWYEEVTGGDPVRQITDYGYPSTNYRTPFGIYNPLQEGGATEVDEYLATGSTVGLHRAESLFPELQP